jgi:hypothetical protein
MNQRVINILSASKIGNYQLRLGFDDRTTQDIEFGPFLSHSTHPEIRAYLDEERFDAFHLEHGELVWGDYDLCFPITDLYNNQIEKHANLKAVA